MAWQSFVCSLALVPIALLATIAAGSGVVYSVGAAVLSVAFLYFSERFAFHRADTAARQFLVPRIFYLPLLFTSNAAIHLTRLFRDDNQG